MAIVGTAGFGLLTDAEEQKTKAVFRAWVTQLHQYKETYKHFPPVLLQFEEGKAVELGREFEDNHDKFVASLKGKKWDRNSRNWLPLENFRDQNKRQREFHSFTEDEFGEGNYLSDAWGNDRIFVVVDRDGDGLIKLESQTLNEIASALKR